MHAGLQLKARMSISYLVPSPDTSACDEDSMSDKIDMLPFCGRRNHAVVISKSRYICVCIYVYLHSSNNHQANHTPPPKTTSVVHNINIKHDIEVPAAWGKMFNYIFLTTYHELFGFFH